MNEDLLRLSNIRQLAPWRMKLANFVESNIIQTTVILVIIINAIVLGLETSPQAMNEYGNLLLFIDKVCLVIFIVEIILKLLAYQRLFIRNSWNIFDVIVVGIALAPGAGPWVVLRTLRVLRVLRLLSMIPKLRLVVEAFLHSIPGLAGVAAVMAIFFYTASVLVTKLYQDSFPEWFGSIGKSLYTLFQIMTLESWSMGIVRPVMETYPLSWLFFVPFIIIATFTILNLFIGIIVSTMQELSLPAPKKASDQEIQELIEKLDLSLEELKSKIQK
jgi:voltage-gated sodium channel